MTKQRDNERLIVIGTGVAGLSAALAAAERGVPVAMVTAGEARTGSSWWAQGGIAAAVGANDSPDLHFADTMAVGARLNDGEAVRVLVERGREAVLRLVASGVPFDGGPDGPELTLEAGHSRRRILHANGGATGEMISAALFERVLASPLIEVVANTAVERLVLDGGRVVGVESRQGMLMGRAVVLATGGYAGLWARSSNPPSSNGTGAALAWNAGAALADIEFVQFHPTALDLPGAPAFLLSEALRGEGALLVDANGRDAVAPLLPRDVVARAITRHMREKGPVFLSLRHIGPRVRTRFAAIARELDRYGLDLATDLIPVAPAAHYCMGGARTDTWGRTTVPGLYAAGEVACTGVQGANRLASNSLLECLVFGERAAEAVATDGPDARAAFHLGPLPEDVSVPAHVAAPDEHYSAGCLAERLQADLCVEREPEAMAALVADLPAPDEAAPASHLVASLAARAALMRQESRGAHYRVDYPAASLSWRGRIVWRREAPPMFEEVR
jgi:L-aspartate oxidase